MPPDFSDPKVTKQLEKDARAREAQDDVTLNNFMSTMAGRELIWKMLEAAHVFSTSFNSNPIEMAFNEGQRNPGLKLYSALMRSCPDLYVEMWREANARDAAIERTLSEDGDGRDQGPGEQQLDLYRDIASGKITVDFGDNEAA